MLTPVAVSRHPSLRDVGVPPPRPDVVTRADRSGQTSPHPSMRLLSGLSRGGGTWSSSGSMRLLAVGAGGGFTAPPAGGGGPQSALGAGPPPCGGPRDGGPAGRAPRRKGPISLQLGFAGDDFGYLVDLGLPQQ